VHSGSRPHDARGGFASNPELAREAGRKGGEAVSKKYGPQFYREIGRRGGLKRAARYAAVPLKETCLTCDRDWQTCHRYLKAKVDGMETGPGGYVCSEYLKARG
jgi:general stress protein YciG